MMMIMIVIVVVEHNKWIQNEIYHYITNNGIVYGW
jgi:hypothetical protein